MDVEKEESQSLFLKDWCEAVIVASFVRVLMRRKTEIFSTFCPLLENLLRNVGRSRRPRLGPWS